MMEEETYELQSESRISDTLFEALAAMSDLQAGYQAGYDPKLFIEAMEILDQSYQETQSEAVHYAFHFMFTHAFHWGLVAPQEIAHLKTAEVE
jgi:hypothetical protein